MIKRNAFFFNVQVVGDNLIFITMDSAITPKQVSQYLLTLGIQVPATFIWYYFPSVSLLLSFLFFPLLFGTTSLLVKDKILTRVFVLQCLLIVLLSSYLGQSHATDQVGRYLANLNFHATLIASSLTLYGIVRRVKAENNIQYQNVADLLLVGVGSGVVYLIYVLFIKVGEG